MKSHFELAGRSNPLVTEIIRHSYYRINRAWGVSWYIGGSMFTMAKMLKIGAFVELEPTYRDDSHKYWRRYR